MSEMLVFILPITYSKGTVPIYNVMRRRKERNVQRNNVALSE